MDQMNFTTEKQCGSCKTLKPTSEFYPLQAKRGGFSSSCKTCVSSANRIRYIENKEMMKARGIAWYAKNAERMKIAKAVYCAANVEKVAAGKAAWAAANVEKVAAGKAAWAAANAEKVAAGKAAWCATNKGWRKAGNATQEIAYRNRLAMYYRKNKERILANNVEWRRKNKEALRGHQNNRRARKIGSGGKISKGLVVKLFQLQKGMCPCCVRPLGDDYHLDHVMPLALGGPNEDWNMQLLRKTCNLQKHAAHPVNFMQSRGFLL